MKYIDPKLGVPLPERDYGGNCLIYDPGNAADPYHNIWVNILYTTIELFFDDICLYESLTQFLNVFVFVLTGQNGWVCSCSFSRLVH